MFKEKALEIIVGARKSPLSQQQIHEVLSEIRRYHSEVNFLPILLATQGDKDLNTSLRDLDKTDFFTKEIDDLLLQKKCRIAIHSAKDLPEPLPKGIVLAALTEGVDSSDSLVLRDGEELYSLPAGAVIATSSIRREEAVKALRSDLQFQDIRGTIEQRLQKLTSLQVDGVVVAEAALIRLGLQNCNRVKLPGETAPLQGKLAITARENDKQMLDLFSCLDSRKKSSCLYLGIEPPFSGFEDRRVIHKPVIAIEPKKLSDVEEDFRSIPLYTHLIFTSKTAVRLFFQTLALLHMPLLYLKEKIFIAVGQATKSAIEAQGFQVKHTAQVETAEGLVEELRIIEPEAFFFWPHSSGARPVISEFLFNNNFRFKECVLYSTAPMENFEMPDGSLFHEIVFTSPSTVEAFFQHQPNFQEQKILTAIGPVTESCLAKYRQDRQK